MSIARAMIPALLLFGYCAIQTWRDVRRKNYGMAAWGGLLALVGLFGLVFVPMFMSRPPVP